MTKRIHGGAGGIGGRAPARKAPDAALEKHSQELFCRVLGIPAGCDMRSAQDSRRDARIW